MEEHLDSNTTYANRVNIQLTLYIRGQGYDITKKLKRKLTNSKWKSISGSYKCFNEFIRQPNKTLL